MIIPPHDYIKWSPLSKKHKFYLNVYTFIKLLYIGFLHISEYLVQNILFSLFHSDIFGFSLVSTTFISTFIFFPISLYINSGFSIPLQVTFEVSTMNSPTCITVDVLLRSISVLLFRISSAARFCYSFFRFIHPVLHPYGILAV
ncbi:unnamed protein product [Heterobilharzia americana]|nr:unnamed protein product [Heterobilharzia americana]